MGILKKKEEEKKAEETLVETEAGFTPPEEVVETTKETPEVEKQVIPQEAEPAGEVIVAADKPASMVSLKDKIEPGLFGYGANKLVPAGSEAQIKPEKILIGKHFDAQVLSYNTRWSVGPKDAPNSDKDAKFLFRDSYDNKTVEDSELGIVTIEEYIEKALTKYPAGGEIKVYLDVIVAAIGCENKTQEDMFLEKMLFVVQLSPSVTKKFHFFAGTAGMKALSGRMSPIHQTCMRFTASPGPNTDYVYSIFTFGSCPADVLASYTPMDASAVVG